MEVDKAIMLLLLCTLHSCYDPQRYNILLDLF
jgi:hypothetical protein